jgi:hypothetical protein
MEFNGGANNAYTTENVTVYIGFRLSCCYIWSRSGPHFELEYWS